MFSIAMFYWIFKLNVHELKISITEKDNDNQYYKKEKIMFLVKKKKAILFRIKSFIELLLMDRILFLECMCLKTSKNGHIWKLTVSTIVLLPPLTQ